MTFQDGGEAAEAGGQLRLRPLHQLQADDNHDPADTAPKADQRKRKCTHCGEMLPDDPQILKLHEEHYHFQDIIQLD